MNTQEGSMRRRLKAAACAAVVLLSCSKQPQSLPALPPVMVESREEHEKEQPPFDLGLPLVDVPKTACRSFPEVEMWSKARRMDPLLVRAFILSESGFDPCAAGKACSMSTIKANSASGCLPADGSGNSQGYSAGFDEMHDPRGSCVMRNPPPSPDPAWRWVGLGLMQTPHPPYTYWEDSSGTPGPYNHIYKRSGFYQLDLNEASACSHSFNPFIASESICLGTSVMKRLEGLSRAFIQSHRKLLGWDPGELSKDRAFSVYISGNMYSGMWNSSARSRDFNTARPSCQGSLANGECFVQSFSESRMVGDAYCQSDGGLSDPIRCKEGQPRQEPPAYCYGYTDIITFIRECRIPYLSPSIDLGADKLRAYYSLRNACR
ncbi:MAG: hypothetical protein U0R44_03225 [Candidatus Micrarchaeia archaeon]